MSMTLLQIVQQVRGRLGQPIPGSVAGNTDPGILQCMGILNEFLDDLSIRQFWQSNTREATFVATVAEDQGALGTLFPYGYEGLIPDTFYNRTTMLSVQGGLNAAEWSARKAMNMSGPLPAFRVRGNNLLFNPIPAAAQTFSVEYFSSYFVYNPSSVTYRKYWELDTDTCLLGDTLPMAYLKWAWRKEKGLDYAEDFRKYEALVATKGLRDKRPTSLSMDSSVGSVGPGVTVSPGSWPL